MEHPHSHQWVKLFSGMEYCTAMRKARHVKEEEAKLRKHGSGNYQDVMLRLASDMLGHKLYDVWVLPLVKETSDAI
jgi:hypothetical protein